MVLVKIIGFYFIDRDESLKENCIEVILKSGWVLKFC